MDDVLVVGESLIDVVERRDGTCSAHPGGSPANVALGLARLGRSAHLLTRIGDDTGGRRIREHLETSGVHLVPGSVTAQGTSTATARIDDSGAATYDFDLDWRLPVVPDLGRYRSLHTGSVAAFLTPGGDQVVDLVESAAGRLTISYDPNIRPGLMGTPAGARLRVEHLASRADLVKVSDEDLGWLYPGADPESVARQWLAGGPAVVVLTLGGRGAVGFCASGRAAVPAPEITVQDTVGAGDSFMSGLIEFLAGRDLLGGGRRAALRTVGGEVLTAMLDRAARIAAITCTRAGADPPTLAELDGVVAS